MDTTQLQDLLDAHQDMEFPEFPDHEAFAEWVDELFEVDDYYVGLISSLLDGHLEDIDRTYLETLQSRFTEIVPDKADQKIHAHCVTYLLSLEHLVAAAI